MKPVVIVPPAPQRWPAFEELFASENRVYVDDLRIRIAEGVSGAHDAFAIVPEGQRILGCVGIGRCGDVGVVRPAFVHPDHRRHGIARLLLDAVASWFEMTGGKWLYLSATAELDQAVYGRFNFEPLHRAFWQPHARLMMLRRFGDAPATPYETISAAEPAVVRPLTRADAPAMTALLQHGNGPDPRVPLEESAVAAEVFVLDLLAHQDRGAGLLFGEWTGSRLTAFGSTGLDRAAARTYALIVPFDHGGELLRKALEQAARERGYEHVDYPMEKLAVWHHGA